MEARRDNPIVAMIANTKTKEMRNAPAGDGSPKDSCAAATASPSRLTRSTSAKGGPPAKSGNGDVADNVQEPATKGSKPVAAASDKGAPPLSDAELLVAKDAQIADLTAKLSNHPVDKPTEGNQPPKLTMSTEATDVPVCSEEYWVDVNAKTRKNVVVAKPGPKPKTESKGLHWVGYCVEGCGCAVCVKKREEPSKTEMHDSKRVPKKTRTLWVHACNCCVATTAATSVLLQQL